MVNYQSEILNITIHLSLNHYDSQFLVVTMVNHDSGAGPWWQPIVLCSPIAHALSTVKDTPFFVANLSMETSTVVTAMGEVGQPSVLFFFQLLCLQNNCQGTVKLFSLCSYWQMRHDNETCRALPPSQTQDVGLTMVNPLVKIGFHQTIPGSWANPWFHRICFHQTPDVAWHLSPYGPLRHLDWSTGNVAARLRSQTQQGQVTFVGDFHTICLGRRKKWYLDDGEWWSAMIDGGSWSRMV